MDDRESRFGWWVSGGAHTALILWAILGGVFFRPQPSTPIRSTEVSTMSGAEFEALAAASRGAGPVTPDATAVTAIADPADDTDGAAAPATSSAPDTASAAQELAQPDTSEAQPDLSDFGAQEPVAVATDLPDTSANQTDTSDAPVAPAGTDAPIAETQPARPEQPATDQPATPVAPRSELALDQSSQPRSRPDGLVEAYRARVAAAEAARQAAADAARASEEAARQAAAEQERLDEQRQAAEDAAAEAAEEAAAEARRQAAREAAEEAEAEAAQQAEAAREAEAAERRAEQERRNAAERAETAAREERAAEERRAAEAREAEERRQAERAEAAAEADRQAAERAAEERRAAEAREAEERAEEERRAAAERAAEEREAAAREAEERAEADRQAAAEREAAEREAAAQAEADAAERALEERLRAANEAAAGGAEGADPATTGQADAGNAWQIEGGSGASANQDPLAAALSGAMGNGNAAPQPDPSVAPMQLLPSPADLPQRGAQADVIPMGPPLSLAERDGFRMALRDCWNVGALSVEASRMTVSVGFSLSRDGHPDAASLRIADYRGGSETAARQAFDVARRAILMCGRAGYPLPADKYERWRDVVVDFRPDGIAFE